MKTFKFPHIGILGAAMLFSGIALAGTTNDLSITKHVTLKARLFQAFNATTRQNDAFLSVDHPYTNTLSCNGKAPLKVLRNAIESEINVKIDALAVFPKAAFGVLDHPISQYLPPNEKLSDSGADQEIEVTCSGWNALKSLPEETCSAINPRHEETCTLLYEGQKKYPLLYNDQYLGSCACK